MLEGIEAAVNTLKRQEKDRMKQLTYIRIDGSVDAVKRDDYVAKFQNSETCRVRRGRALMQ